MGNVCRKNKAKEPKRKEIDELAEKERLEREAAEAEQKLREEEEEVVEEPEPEPEPEPEEEPEPEPEEEEPEPEEAPETVRVEEEPEPEPEPEIEESVKSPSETYSQSQKIETASEKVPSSTELTLSTEATAIQPPTKMSEPAHEESIHSTYRSVTPCDMNRVDATAKVCSQKCGCDLGDRHDENNCKICRKIDLSDTPLLN